MKSIIINNVSPGYIIKILENDVAQNAGKSVPAKILSQGAWEKPMTLEELNELKKTIKPALEGIGSRLDTNI